MGSELAFFWLACFRRWLWAGVPPTNGTQGPRTQGPHQSRAACTLRAPCRSWPGLRMGSGGTKRRALREESPRAAAAPLASARLELAKQPFVEGVLCTKSLP